MPLDIEPRPAQLTREAVARHPGDPMSRVNLGNVLYEAGEFQGARESILKLPSASIPAIAKRIRGSPTCWPNWAMKQVHECTAARLSRIAP